MRKLAQIVLILSTIFTVCVAYAQTIYGHCVIQNLTLDDLTCYGPTDISNTLIKGKLVVNGSLNMNKVDASNIEVKGPLEANNSIIRGKVIAYGPISATNTQFMSEIYAATSLMQLTKSTIASDINIRSEQQQPIVEMHDYAIIFGNLSFTQQEGLVKMSADSEIKGTISNGRKEESKADNKPEPKQPSTPETKPADNSASKTDH